MGVLRNFSRGLKFFSFFEEWGAQHPSETIDSKISLIQGREGGVLSPIEHIPDGPENSLVTNMVNFSFYLGGCPSCLSSSSVSDVQMGLCQVFNSGFKV